MTDTFDPFEDDMRRSGGRYYPPDPVVRRCTCVAPCEAEPAGSTCAYCEEEVEVENDLLDDLDARCGDEVSGVSRQEGT